MDAATGDLTRQSVQLLATFRGKARARAGKRNRLSDHDVLEDLRLHGNVANVANVELAIFERNGQISAVLRG
jgi:uncharacterized membrane protein YcaP (DUF421 family)